MITQQQIFENRKSTVLDIQMEPRGEVFTLAPGQQALFEWRYLDGGTPVTIAIYDDYISVYEEFGVSTRVFVNDMPVYSSW